METKFINTDTLPFCSGCGHTTISRNTEKALQKIGLNLLDVILVTDIGCHGIIDKAFDTHTVHGLHGRSVALASGISAGVNNPDKKVIVYIGDGGASIGMQHLLDAAHNGYNMTVVVHNNMLYGMTGGQPSELTPKGFKTPTLPQGATHKGYDICGLVATAGASYVSRITGIGDISDQLAEAFSRTGFSLVEVMEICPSYGVKSNPGIKLKTLIEEAGIEIKVYADNEPKAFETQERNDLPSLFSPSLEIKEEFTHRLDKPVRLFLSGTAGEGVQSAAEMFIRAGMRCGLQGTKKGSYPVTVGVGFSASNLILSPEPIFYTGAPRPDVILVTSEDGIKFARKLIDNAGEEALLIIDSTLETPKTRARVVSHHFREHFGGRNAMITALFEYLRQSNIISMDALKKQFMDSKMAANTKLKALIEETFGI
ncbi:MAG: 2-oxoacid:acceptor oxidoreductase family protein [Bacteroidales bacterium]|nr:2-oxoacid:acceptor oxidoreductase family protein [Bacteroidales bacterium]